METNYSEWIGKHVRKSAKKSTNIKPFKSQLQINTVKGIIKHPHLYTEENKIMAFTFHEDDSFVKCSICELVS